MSTRAPSTGNPRGAPQHRPDQRRAGARTTAGSSTAALRVFERTDLTSEGERSREKLHLYLERQQPAVTRSAQCVRTAASACEPDEPRRRPGGMKVPRRSFRSSSEPLRARTRMAGPMPVDDAGAGGRDGTLLGGHPHSGRDFPLVSRIFFSSLPGILPSMILASSLASLISVNCRVPSDFQRRPAMRK